MIHEIVEAIHQERPIAAGRINNHTHIFHDRGTAVKMAETEVTLKFKSRFLAGDKTTRSAKLGQLLERVGHRLRQRGFVTNSGIAYGGKGRLVAEKGTNTYYILALDRKKQRGYDHHEIRITGNWGSEMPAIERIALERKLQKLLVQTST